MSISNLPIDIIEIDCEVKAETMDAVLLHDSVKTEWFPKSQLEDWPDVGQTGTVLMKEWIALKKGFI